MAGGESSGEEEKVMRDIAASSESEEVDISDASGSGDSDDSSAPKKKKKGKTADRQRPYIEHSRGEKGGGGARGPFVSICRAPAKPTNPDPLRAGWRGIPTPGRGARRAPGLGPRPRSPSSGPRPPTIPPALATPAPPPGVGPAFGLVGRRESGEPVKEKKRKKQKGESSSDEGKGEANKPPINKQPRRNQGRLAKILVLGARDPGIARNRHGAVLTIWAAPTNNNGDSSDIADWGGIPPNR